MDDDEIKEAYRKKELFNDVHRVMQAENCQLASCGKKFTPTNPRVVRSMTQTKGRQVYIKRYIICRYHTTDEAALKGEHI